jgi:hypothetical protein
MRGPNHGGGQSCRNAALHLHLPMKGRGKGLTSAVWHGAPPDVRLRGRGSLLRVGLTCTAPCTSHKPRCVPGAQALGANLREDGGHAAAPATFDCHAAVENHRRCRHVQDDLPSRRNHRKSLAATTELASAPEPCGTEVGIRQREGAAPCGAGVARLVRDLFGPAWRCRTAQRRRNTYPCRRAKGS